MAQDKTMSLDTTLGLISVIGVAVSFMEPRAFWLGAILCVAIAVITIIHRFKEAKTFYRERRKKQKTYNKKIKVPAGLKRAAIVVLLSTTAPILLYFTRTEPILNYGAISLSWPDQVINYFAPPRPPIVRIGNSGVSFSSGRFSFALPVLARDQLRIDSIWRGMVVSTEITDKDGVVIAALSQNEWKVAPPHAWDRNYNSNTLEVLNDKREVVLQVRLVSNEVQIQGAWWVDFGPPNGLTRVVIRKSPRPEGGAEFVLNPKEKSDEGKIQPIFEYPSEFHFGELKKQ